MLCSHRFHSALSPLTHFSWPEHSLWPEVKGLLHQQDLLQGNLQELMDELQHRILEEAEPQQSSSQLEKEEQHLDLTLDARGFSPEELCVRLLDGKLMVSGKTEKKQEGEDGSCSYRCQEFRQELDLPEGLKPEGLTCCLDPDGKLHIQADKAPCVEEAERELLPIQTSSKEETQHSVCSHRDTD